MHQIIDSTDENIKSDLGIVNNKIKRGKMNLKAHKKPPKSRERSASYDVGLLLLASHLNQSASSAENLQIFRIHLFAFGLLELSRHISSSWHETYWPRINLLSSLLELVRPVPVPLLVRLWEVKVLSPWTFARLVFCLPFTFKGLADLNL